MSAVLPSLYQAWVDDILPGSIPDESFATCSACPMIERPDKPSQEPAFLPQTKCCTYTPDLPNFVVGRILAGTDIGGAHGRAVLRQRLQARVAVSPLGIHPIPIYQTLYDAATAEQSAFGRTATLCCPLYLEDGRCGIWQYREAVCSTWFCKYERGVMGRTFWRVLLGLLRSIETNLKFWCLDKAGLAAEPLAELWAASDQGRGKGLDEHALDNVASPELYRRLWGDAGDRAEAFFARCAELVAPLRYADVLAIGGASVAAAAHAARVVYDKAVREQPIPERLARNPHTLIQLGRRPGETRVRHMAMQYDWLDLPAGLAAQLGRFDNAPVARVIDELRAEGVAVDEALVRRLLDWQALVPA